MVITVKSLTRTYRLDVSLSAPTDSIVPFLSPADCRALGSSKRLVSNSTPVDLHQTFTENGIVAGAVLLLVPVYDACNSVTVKVMYEGKVESLVCELTCSVKQLKEYCGRLFKFYPSKLIVADDEEVLKDEQQLSWFYTGNLLSIYIEKTHPDWTEGSFGVTVQTLTGACIPIRIHSGMAIDRVKDAICANSNLRHSELRLIFAGKDLSDEMIVGQLNIASGSVIHVVLRLR